MIMDQRCNDTYFIFRIVSLPFDRQYSSLDQKNNWFVLIKVIHPWMRHEKPMGTRIRTEQLKFYVVDTGCSSVCFVVVFFFWELPGPLFSVAWKLKNRLTDEFWRRSVVVSYILLLFINLNVLTLHYDYCHISGQLAEFITSN